MLIKMGSGGGGIDVSDKPQITFDGKWVKWFVEFYGGEPYWEAQFFSSGTLTVEGSYTADVWGIGGGYGAVINTSTTNFGGRGDARHTLGASLQGTIPITIGAAGGSDGFTGNNGGDTGLGSILSVQGGRLNTEAVGTPYRFSDSNKQHEAGADGSGRYAGRGGWLFWRDGISKDKSTEQAGEGYGGGGYFGHPGALVIRIKI